MIRLLSVTLLLLALLICPVGYAADAKLGEWEKLETAAEEAFINDDMDKAGEFWTKALELAQSDKSQALNEAMTLNQLNHLFVRTGEYKKAHEYLKRALTIRRRELGENHLLTAETVGNLALISHKLGHDHEAEKLYLESLAIKDKLLGKDSYESATTLHNLANLYSQHRKYKKAKESYERVLKIDKSRHGEHHIEVIRDLTSLGISAYRCKMFEESVEYLKKANEEAAHELRPYKQELIPIYHYLGLSYGKLSKHHQAKEYHQLAHKLGIEVHGKHYPGNTIAQLNLAQITDEMGDDKEAETIYIKALRHEEARPKLDPYLMTEVNLELGQYYHRHDLDDKAEEFYKVALKYFDGLPDHLKRSLYELPVAYSDLLAKEGKDKEAEKLATKYLFLHTPHKDGHFRMK